MNRAQWVELFNKSENMKDLRAATGEKKAYDIIRDILVDWVTEDHNAADAPLNALLEFGQEHLSAESTARNIKLLEALCTIHDFIDEENARSSW